MFIIWTLLVIKFAIPIGSLMGLQSPNLQKLVIFGGFIVLGVAYLYRLIYLVIYNLDGDGIYAFELIYLVLKNLG
jgi:hypothetical protein